MGNKRLYIIRIAYAGLIAALYLVITLFTSPISYGPVQFRIAEALNILPLFFPEAILGLTIGCFISNIFSPGIVLLDMTIGTSATLISAILCYFIGKTIKKESLKVIIAIIPCIVINAIFTPFTFLALTELKELYFIQLLWILLGQIGVLTIIGIPFYYTLKSLDKRYHLFF